MKGLLGFAAGLMVGAVAGIYLAKDKIMTDAKAEIEEVREYYKNKKDKHEGNETVENASDEEVNEKYESMVNEYESHEEIEQPHVSKSLDYQAPYIIDPEEFGANEEYDTMTLTYFADKVLTDDVDEVIEEPDPVVGLDNLQIFEEHPDATSIYVRNEVWCTDFEILRDDWDWASIQGNEPEKKPHQL